MFFCVFFYQSVPIRAEKSKHVNEKTITVKSDLRLFFIKKDLHDILPRLVRLQLKIKVLQYYTV